MADVPINNFGKKPRSKTPILSRKSNLILPNFSKNFHGAKKILFFDINYLNFKVSFTLFEYIDFNRTCYYLAKL